MISVAKAVELYDQLLASIGARASDIAPRLCVSHWPHVGTAFDGLLIVGQALRGWPDEWQATEAATEEGRARILVTTRLRNSLRAEPLDWVPNQANVRNSPFWLFSKHLVDLVVPGPAPWYARYAWANLYPVAPEDPPDNPTGPLKEAQDRLVGPLLLELAEMLGARTIVVIAGPIYWYHARRTGELWNLMEQPRPLTWSGSAYGCRWVVGYHPKWASFNGWGAPRYAQLVANQLATVG
jgi:hypothetical protein